MRKLPSCLCIKTLFCLALLDLTLFASSGFTQARAGVPFKRNSVEAWGGGYSLTSNTGTSSSIGVMTVSYGYNINTTYRVGLSYQNVLSGSGGVGSTISGFDLYGQYCFFNCVAEQTQAADVAELRHQEVWGFSGGLGFAQRNFQLENQTIGFAGPFARVHGNYFFAENLKALAGAQYSLLNNAGRALSYLVFSVGLGVDW